MHRNDSNPDHGKIGTFLISDAWNIQDSDGFA